MRTFRSFSLGQASLVLIAMSVLGTACLASKNDLQDFDAGPLRPVLNQGNLMGSIFIQGVDNGASSSLFTNVHITATATNAQGVEQQPTSAFTTSPDLRGHYSFTSVPVGSYRVEASLNGFKTATTEVVIQGSLITTAADLTLTSSGVAVQGCVKFPAKIPDGNAVTVQLFSGSTPAGDSVPLTAANCSDGAPGYPILLQSVTAGSYSAQVVSKGYLAVVPKFTVAASDVQLPIVLASRTLGRVDGTVVVTDPTGTHLTASLQGIPVSLAGDTTVPTVASVQTDATGHFSFPEVAVSPTDVAYTVTAGLPGLTLDTSAGPAPTVLVQPNQMMQPTSPVPLKIATYTVKGCVLVPGPAKDPSGVTASLSGTALIGNTNPYQIPQTGTVKSTAEECIPGVKNSGTYVLSNVPAGTYTLTLSLLGYDKVQLSNINVVNADVGMPPVSLVRSTVSFDGKVLAGGGGTGITNPSATDTLVTLTSPELLGVVYQVYTPSSAPDPTQVAFHFNNVPISISGPTGASYTVTASKSGYVDGIATFKYGAASTTIPSPRPLIAAVSNQVVGCIIVPPAAADTSTISVKVDLKGNAFDGSILNPPRSQTLTLATLPTGPGSSCSPDLPGVPGWPYAFPDVPNGTYSVQVTATGFQPVSLANFPVSSSTQTTSVPTITLVRATGTVSGVATSDANNTGLTATPGGAIATISGPDLLGATYQGVVESGGMDPTTENYSITNVPISPASNGPTNKPYTITLTKPGYTAQQTATATVTTTAAGASNPITLKINANPISVCTIVPSPGTDSNGVKISISGTALATNTAYPASGTALASVGNACGPNQTGLLYTLPGVPDGVYTIQIAAAGYDTITLPNIQMANAPLTLPTQTLSRTSASLSGTVTVADGGTKLSTTDASAVTVAVTGQDLLGRNFQTTTANQVGTPGVGTFSFPSIPVSPTGLPYTVTVSKPHFVTTSTTFTAQAGANSLPSTVTLTMASSNITGCVVAPLPGPDASGIAVTISGTAFDGTSYPPAGKSATALSNAGCASGSGFKFPTVPDGTYTVKFSANGFNTIATSDVIVSGSDVLLPPTQLVRSVGTVSGSIAASDSLGTGLTSFSSGGSAGVLLTMIGTDLLGSTLQTTSDASGHFAFTNVPVSPTNQPYSVAASKPNYSVTSPTSPPSVVVSSTGTTPASLQFNLAISANPVAGCVVVAAPGLPSTVAVKLSGLAFDGTSYQKQVSPSGSCTGAASGQPGSAYSFANVPNGSYTLTFTEPGFDTQTVPNVVVAGAPFNVPTVQLRRSTGLLTGLVVTGVGAAATPVVGATVTVTGADLIGSSFQTATDATGTFTFPNVPVTVTSGSPYTVTVSKPTYGTVTATVTVNLGTNSPTPNPITITPNASTVSGCVTVPAPAPNSLGVSAQLAGTGGSSGFTPVTVTSNSTCPTEQGAGQYVFPSIPDGAYTVTLTQAGYDPVAVQIVVAGSNVSVPPVRFGRATNTVTGSIVIDSSVTPPTGATPLPGGALVTLTSPDLLGATFQTFAAADGTFSITSVPLSQSNAYTLTVSKTGYAATPATQSVTVGSGPGATTTTPVKLAMSTSTVTGCVVVPPPAGNTAAVGVSLSGPLASDAQIIGNYVQPKTGTLTTSGVCPTGPGTAYTLSGVPYGLYTISLTLAGYDTYAIPSVAVSGPNVTVPTVTLARSITTISGKVVNPTQASPTGVPASPANATVTLTSPDLLGNSLSTTTASDGSYSFSDLPVNTGTNRYTVMGTKSGYVTAQTQVVLTQNNPLTGVNVTLAVAASSVSGCVYVPSPGDVTQVIPSLSGTAFDGTTAVSASGATIAANTASPSSPCYGLPSSWGQYTINNVPNGSFTLQLAYTAAASTKYYAPVTIPGVAVAATTSGTTVTIPPVQMTRAVGAVTGTVVINNTTTLNIADYSGVTVTLTGKDLLGTPFSTVTDGTGFFNFPQIPISPTGEVYQLVISKPNFVWDRASTGVTLTPTAPTASIASSSLTLKVATANLTGCVGVPAPGSPSGVQVSLSGIPFDGSSLSRLGTFTGACANGAAGVGYSFSNLPNGQYSLTFTATNFDSLTVSGISLAGVDLTAPAATLSRSVTSISGKVAADNNMTGLTTGIDGSNVTVTLTGSDLVGQSFQTTTVYDPVNTVYKFSFPSVPLSPTSQAYQLTFTKPSFTSVTTGITLAKAAFDAGTTTLSVQTSTITGCVFVPSSAMPTGGISATLTGTAFNGASFPPTAKATVAANGACASGSGQQYQFTGVPNGSYTVTLTASGIYSPLTIPGVVVTGNTTLPTQTMVRATGGLYGAVAVQNAATTQVSLTGADAQGVTVTVTGTDTPVVNYTSISDSAGNWRVASMPVSLTGSAYTVSASKPGYVFQSTPIVTGTVVGGTDTQVTTSLKLVVATSKVSGCVQLPTPAADSLGILTTLSGTAFNGTQYPPPGGTTIQYTTTTSSTQCGTGNTGRQFVFNTVPNGTYTIAFSLANYNVSTLSNIIVAGSDVGTTNVVMSRSNGSVSGVVNVPLPLTDPSGVKAVLTGATTQGVATTINGDALSDTNGNYTFSSVPPGTYNLTLSKSGFNTALLTGITVTSGANTSVPTQTLTRMTISFSGSVTTAANGTGVQLSAADVAGALVSVVSGTTSIATATTDANGNWTIPSLAVPLSNATYTVSVSKAGYIQDAGTPPVSVLLGPTSTANVAAGVMTLDVLPSQVSGCVVVPAPAPNSAGVTVTLSGTAFNGTSYPRVDLTPLTVSSSSTTCGPSNTGNAFVFGAIPNGTYTVVFSRTGYDPQTSASFTVAGSNLAVPTATLSRSTGILSGTVLAMDSGTGLIVDGSGATVTLSATNSDLSGATVQATTDSGGNYTISGVPVSPTGVAYTVNVTKGNFTTIGSTSVVVQPNTQTRAGPVTLQLNTYVVTGSVSVPAPALDSAGVSAVMTGTAFNGNTWTGSADALTDPNGNYKFSRVPASSATGYSITFTRSGYAAVTVSGIVVPTSGPATNHTALTQGGGSIRGTISVNANGTGLTLNGGSAMTGADNQNFTVTLTGIGFPQSYTLTTDTNGAWPSGGGLTNVLSGTYNVTISKTGYNTVTTTATVATNATTVVPSQTMNVSAYSLNGTIDVEGSADDSGVAGVLTGTAFNGVTFTKSADATSNTSGNITFSGIPVGSNYTVKFTKSGYTELDQTNVVVAAPPASLPTLGGLMHRSANKVSGCVQVPAPATSWAGVNVVLSGTDYTGATYQFPPQGSMTQVLSTSNCSNASGTNFSFSNVPDGNYSLALTITGYDALTVTGITVAGTDVVAPTAKMSRSTNSINGTVNVSAGTSGLTPNASGALVSLLGTELLGVPYQTTVSFNATSMSYGYTFTNVPVSPTSTAYQITVAQPNYASSTSTTPATVLVTAATQAATASTVTLTIITSTVSGCLVVPPPGATSVPVVLTGTAFDGTSVTVNKTASGSCSGGQPGLAYSFSNIPNGSYSVQVNNFTGYDNLNLTNITVAATATGGTVTVPSARLQRSLGTITGSVTAIANGTNISADPTGATVTLAGSDLSGALFQTTVSGGTFTFSSVPLNTGTNSYTVSVSKTGYTSPMPVSVSLTSSTASAPSMQLAVTSYALNGTVTVDGQLSSGVTATLSGTAFDGSTYTLPASGSMTVIQSNSSGQFQFASVPAGTYSVTLALSGNASYVPATISPVVLPGSSSISGALVRGTGTVSGSITLATPSGMTGFTPVAADKAGVVVTITDPSGGFGTATYSTVTDSNGNFSLAGVPAPASSSQAYTVTASKASFTTATSTVTVAPRTTSSPATNPMTLTVNSGSVSVAVVLNDQFKNTSAGLNTYATIPVTLSGTAFDGQAVGPLGANTVSGNSGIATFANLPPGNYLATAATYEPSGAVVNGSSVSALSQHVSDGPKPVTIPASGTSPGTVTITLTDQLPPSTPVIALSNQSPTSSLTTKVSIVQNSTDPTLPYQNFWNYIVKACKLPVGGTLNCPTSSTPWDGSTPLSVNLTNGVDNYVQVTPQDDNGNLGTPAYAVIHVETSHPSAPTNVHVDNRPGGAYITWNASSTSGTLPVGGYKLYYGPISSTSPADYTGIGAAQGVSPIDVKNNTSLTLTGLPNGVAFYVAVQAYDTAVDPSPNTSTLSATSTIAAPKVLPGVTPFDRTVHQTVAGGSSSNPVQSMVVLKDDVIVSTGPNASNKYTLQPYRYTQYGSLTSFGGSQQSSHARYMVAEDNYFAYAFDPAKNGIDIFTLDATTQQFSFAASASINLVDHLVPLHRSATTATPGGTHGVYTNTNGSKQYIGTFGYDIDHQGITADNPGTTQLVTQGGTCDLKATGTYAFTIHDQALNAYILQPDFSAGPTAASTSAGYTHPSVTVPGSSPGVCRTMALEWPRVYFSGGSGNDGIYLSQITNWTNGASQNLTFDSGTPTLVGTLAGPATKMILAGDHLYVGEQINGGVIAVEAFSLANPTALVRDGWYEINTNGEDTTSAQVADMHLSGSNLYVLITSASTGQGWIDVVELGGPRSMQEVSSYAATSGSAQLVQGLAATVRGGRAIAYMADGTWSTTSPNANARVVSVDLSGDFAAATAGNNMISQAINTTFDTSLYTAARALSLPMVVYSDYAFAAMQTPGSSTGQVWVFDMSSPSASQTPAPILKIATAAPVTGLAAANDYLYVTEDSSSNWMQRFDIQNIGNVASLAATSTPQTPSGFVAPGRGLAVDVAGDYVYVATQSGYCQLESDGSSAPPPTGGAYNVQVCLQPVSSQSSSSIFYDAGNIYTTVGSPFGTGAIYVEPGASANKLPNPNAVALSATPAIEDLPLATTGTVFGIARGPNLFATIFDSTTGLSGLAGFDVTNSLGLPLAQVDTLKSAALGSFGIAGSLIVVPDTQRGLVLMKAY